MLFNRYEPQHAKVKEKDPMKYLTKVVTFCIAFIVIYTIAQVVLSYFLQVELSPTLTNCVYTFFGTELAACAFIKIVSIVTKILYKKYNLKDDESDISEDIEG